LPATACLLGRSHAFTDADGRFAVARTKSGRGRVAVQASGRFTLVADAVGKDGRLPRTLVLPELRAVEGEPAVGVTLADPGAHPLVRVARHGATLRDFAGHPGETVVHVPLRERAMMDVVVTSHRSDGSAPTVRRFTDVAVVDGVMLPTR
jgi:hypothetical protein